MLREKITLPDEFSRRASSRDNPNNYRAIIVLPGLLLDAVSLRDQTD